MTSILRVFYLVTSMLTACGFKIFWVIISPDSGDALTKAAHFATCIDYVLIAILLFMSMRGSPWVSYYFGFLEGQLTKAFFLLFCANLVWPINVKDENGDKHISAIITFLKILSWFLIGVAIL